MAAASGSLTTPVDSPTSIRARRTGWAKVAQLIRGNPLGTFGLVVVLCVILMALLAPVLAPYDPTKMDLEHVLAPPTWAHPMGTDYYGRDVLSRVIYGARVTLLVGTVCVSVALVAGLAIGLTAGYVRGMVDVVLMRLMDAILSFPPILLAIALLGALGPSIANAMLALSIVYTPQVARMIRGMTLSIREEMYVTAARSVGARDVYMIRRHILPNGVAPVIVQASANFAYAIISEATLSFLGLGVQPPTPAWGEMVSSGKAYAQDAYWLILFPCLAITIFVIAVNLLGDSIRDMMDPRYRSILS